MCVYVCDGIVEYTQPLADARSVSGMGMNMYVLGFPHVPAGDQLSFFTLFSFYVLSARHGCAHQQVSQESVAFGILRRPHGLAALLVTQHPASYAVNDESSSARDSVLVGALDCPPLPLLRRHLHHCAVTTSSPGFEPLL